MKPGRNSVKRTDYVGLMLCMIMASGLFLLWTAQFWNIQKVEIKGATINTERHVQAFVENEHLQGMHLLKVNPLVLKKRLEANPLVKQVTFEREILPAYLTLKVQERLPRYVLYSALPLYDKMTKKVQVPERYAKIVDAEGIILPLPVKRFEYAGPHFYLKPSLIKKKLSAEHLNLIRELEALDERELLDHNGVFDISNPQNLIFYLNDPSLRVWLGMPEDLLLKMQLIDSTHKGSGVPESEIEYIDLRFWKHPVVKKRT
jgi:hypothetical protein